MGGGDAERANCGRDSIRTGAPSRLAGGEEIGLRLHPSTYRVREKFSRKVVVVTYRQIDRSMLCQRLHWEDLCRGRSPEMCH